MNDRTGGKDPFQDFLDQLDFDPETAAQRYVELRRDLENYLERKGSRSPREQTDEALNRVAKRIVAGEPIPNLRGSCFETARRIYMESWGPLKEVEIQPNTAVIDPRKKEREEEQELTAEAQRTQRFACMKHCFDGLPLETRWLLQEYVEQARLGPKPIERRKELSDLFRVPQQKLINRIATIRAGLHACVRKCQKNSEAAANKSGFSSLSSGKNI